MCLTFLMKSFQSFSLQLILSLILITCDLHPFKESNNNHTLNSCTSKCSFTNQILVTPFLYASFQLIVTPLQLQQTYHYPDLIPHATWYGVVFQDSASTTFPSGRVTLIGLLSFAALSAIRASCSAFSFAYKVRRSSMYWGGGDN